MENYIDHNFDPDSYALDISHYNQKIREIDEFTNGFGESFIIINRSYWFPKIKYTKEEAIRKYCEIKGIGGYKQDEKNKY